MRRKGLITGAVIVGLSLAAFIFYLHTPFKTTDKYPFLAKGLFLEDANDTLINFQPLRQQVKDYLAKANITHSFYFEYLFTGTNIRDGDNNDLVGASLMKIPIVMDLYKAAEAGKLSLDAPIQVPALPPEAYSNDKEFGNQENLHTGDKITLRQAAKIAMTESDNTAAYTIYSNTKGLLPTDDQAINNLDVEVQTGQSDQGVYVTINSRAYSSFLKCLYFSCYLNQEHSQEILNYLNMSTDDSKLRAGVPSGIPVAHKIGSFSNVTQSDCGIVYVPSRSYVLCIMLDTDKTTAAKHIKALSEMVYTYVKNVN